MKDINISIIQSPLHWENIPENLEMFSQIISSLKEQTALIVLPEMFSTGFTMCPERVAEKMDGNAVQWMKEMAQKKNCVVTGSLAIEENGKYINRLIWQKPDGSRDFYDKKHLFRYANEQEHYTPGSKKLIVDLHGWKICLMICYDLRFPVWCRNQFKDKSSPLSIRSGAGGEVFDLLLFVANWPEKRCHPWKTLLQARAIENQCFVAGVNRIGMDGNGFAYSGDSMVVNPLGEIISKTKAHVESVETVTLSRKELNEWRETFPAWMDADEFILSHCQI